MNKELSKPIWNWQKEAFPANPRSKAVRGALALRFPRRFCYFTLADCSLLACHLLHSKDEVGERPRAQRLLTTDRQLGSIALRAGVAMRGYGSFRQIH